MVGERLGRQLGNNSPGLRLGVGKKGKVSLTYLRLKDMAA